MRVMKDSGIEWIGEIPEEWITQKTRTVCRIRGEKHHPEAQVLSLYRDLGVVIKDERNDNFNVTSENTEEYKFVEKNDLVVNKMKAWQGSIGVSKFEGIVSPAYYVFQITSKKMLPFYLHYLLRNQSYLPEYRRLSGGIRIGQWDLSLDNFKNIPIVIPTLVSQQKIVSFLDFKCSKIDEYVSRQQQVIEKLKEYKQVVITEAVTKGLDPDVPMKDSGVEWIGKIPSTWQARKLKYCLLANLQYGATESGNEYNESYPRYIRITDITDDNKLKEEGKLSLKPDVAEPYILDDSDILFARSGATVGKTFLYKNFYGKAAFAGYMIRAKINNKIVIPEFVYYTTLGNGYNNWKTYIFSQATIQNIGADKYSQLIITIPSLNTQRQIASYLDTKCAAIDAAITRKQELIDKMTEYKKSLIYEAVTGKMEV